MIVNIKGVGFSIIRVCFYVVVPDLVGKRFVFLCFFFFLRVINLTIKLVFFCVCVCVFFFVFFSLCKFSGRWVFRLIKMNFLLLSLVGAKYPEEPF